MTNELTLRAFREVVADDDGMLADIYIPGATLGDWQLLVQALLASPYELEYTLDGEEQPIESLPATLPLLLGPWEGASPLVTIDRGGL